MLYLLDVMTLGQRDMSILGLLARTRYTARLSVKLLVGLCLLCTPAMAQTARGNSPVLIAQGQTVLSEGSRGPAVQELQERLDQRGLFPAAKDGVYGPATTQAVRQFQRIRRLEVTGIADAQTLNLLGIDIDRLPVGLSHPDYGTISADSVSSRSSRDDVRTLQRVLRSFGFDVSVDGIYGGETIQAVRSYQRTADLPVDGVADRATLVNMGFRSGNPSSIAGVSGQSRRSEGRYVAAVIAGRSELSRVQRNFPNATVESNNIGDYISLGRFSERSEAAAWVDFASDLGYEARVLRD
ncbi:MAG: peptidoglycan-binding protein [Cyanobacteria bacterium P01_F01_bin.116]